LLGAKRSDYNNLKKIPHIRVPKLIIQGTNDHIVPYSMGEKLFDAAGAPEYFFPIERTDHNDTYLIDPGDYFKTFATFARETKL
jgi:fermentation-respiration switch protein FrsA (DUF1100 family)